jgi:AcrR family transcriptional regulator
LSTSSHKSNRPRKEKTRAVQAPQRANGRLRVAAILEAAAAVIAEKGYEATTMAEIAERSDTKIGSLYRFFPNKESLAETLVATARENLDAQFEEFDAEVGKLPVESLIEELQALLFKQLITPALKKLLDSSQEWSAKREEFRVAILGRVAKTLIVYSPKLSKKAAGDIALVILLNMKTATTHEESFGPDTGAQNEFREMIRLYLRNRLGLKKP